MRLIRKDKPLVAADASPGLEALGRDWALACVSSAAVDRDLDEMVVEGIDTGPWFRAGAPWFFSHESTQPPIGTSIDPATGKLHWFVKGGKAYARCFFDTSDPHARFLFGKVSKRLLVSTSIAFLPREWERRQPDAKGYEYNANPNGGIHYFRCELTEISWCPVASNRDAILVDASPSFAKSFGAAIDRQCRNGECPSHEDQLAEWLLRQTLDEHAALTLLQESRALAEQLGLFPPGGGGQAKAPKLVRPQNTGREPYRPSPPGKDRDKAECACAKEEDEPMNDSEEWMRTAAFPSDGPTDGPQTGERLLVDQGDVPDEDRPRGRTGVDDYLAATLGPAEDEDGEEGEEKDVAKAFYAEDAQQALYAAGIQFTVREGKRGQPAVLEIRGGAGEAAAAALTRAGVRFTRPSANRLEIPQKGLRGKAVNSNQADLETGRWSNLTHIEQDMPDASNEEILSRYSERPDPDSLQAIMEQALEHQRSGRDRRETLARSDEDLREELNRYRYPSEIYGSPLDQDSDWREDGTHGNSPGDGTNRRRPKVTPAGDNE